MKNPRPWLRQQRVVVFSLYETTMFIYETPTIHALLVHGKR